MNTAKHICPLCDYIYDEQLGDAELGIEPDTAFAKLPGGFKHPACSGSKDMFEACTCVKVGATKDGV